MDKHHNQYFVFKGDRTKQYVPPIVNFKVLMLITSRMWGQTLEEAMEHYSNEATTTSIPMNDFEGEMEVKKEMLIPIKCAADIITI